MTTTWDPTVHTPDAARPDAGDALLAEVVATLQATGTQLVERFRTRADLRTRADVEQAIADGDAAALAILRPRLQALRPQASWHEDELGGGPLPPGETWVVDPVEGAINRVHGLSDWAVTATLASDGEPVLTAVHLPLSGITYTALAGRGAYRDGVRLAVSPKTELRGALVSTGQASPRETPETFAQIARSLEAMMAAAGVTRVSVPPTLQLVVVAAGQWDVFWQHSDVASGLLAGVLLVREAGGTVTDLRGGPWRAGSPDVVVAAPGVHAAALTVLAGA